MITLKIRYTSTTEFYELLAVYRREQSTIFRTAYNRLQEGASQNDIRKSLRSLQNTPHMDSWWVASAQNAATTFFAALGGKNPRNKRPLVFGTRESLEKYLRGKLSKEQYKNHRLLPLTSAGEANQRGNRKFELNVLDDQLIFKDKRGKIRHVLSFESQRHDRLRQLLHIENQALLKQSPLSVQITDTHLHLTFTEVANDCVEVKPNRLLSIDSNPNSIGWSVCDIENDKPLVVDSGVLVLSALNKQTANKKHHETYEISKFLVNMAVHYKCSMFAAEDLKAGIRDHKIGRTFNKTVNNDWIRQKLFSNLRKRCSINNIKYVEVNPAYTSVIGGTLHRDYPDPIAPTLEIARRAYFKYQKGRFYPPMPDVNTLNEQWKQTLEKSFGTWKELSGWLKNTKHRYRVSLESFDTKVFRFKSELSSVTRRELHA